MIILILFKWQITLRLQSQGGCNIEYTLLIAPGRFQFHFRYVIFKLTLVNGGWGISYEIALRRMSLDFTDGKSTLVQAMAWCRQATSQYLSQCWPRSMSPNGVTSPQWVLIKQCMWKTLDTSTVWYKTKFGSQNLATKFGNHLGMATKTGRHS